MVSKQKNLSAVDDMSIPDASAMRIGIVSAGWNKEVTNALLDGAFNTLKRYGASNENILVYHVPGSFELPQGAALMIDNLQPDAVICLGSIIQGETRHFEFIAQSVSQGCIDLSIQTNIPVIFGVLTTDTYDQALQRAGGKHGNKGDEAAVSAIQMAALAHKLKAR